MLHHDKSSILLYSLKFVKPCFKVYFKIWNLVCTLQRNSCGCSEFIPQRANLKITFVIWILLPHQYLGMQFHKSCLIFSHVLYSCFNFFLNNCVVIYDFNSWGIFVKWALDFVYYRAKQEHQLAGMGPANPGQLWAVLLDQHRACPWEWAQARADQQAWHIQGLLPGHPVLGWLPAQAKLPYCHGGGL